MLGADGAWWFSAANGDLARLTTTGSLTTPLSFASGASASAIAAGAGSTLWVSLTGARPAVGLVTGIGSGPSDTTAPTPLQTMQAPTFSSVKVARTARQGNPISLAVLTSNARTLTVRVDRKLPGRRCRPWALRRTGAGAEIGRSLHAPEPRRHVHTAAARPHPRKLRRQPARGHVPAHARGGQRHPARARRAPADDRAG